MQPWSEALPKRLLTGSVHTEVRHLTDLTTTQKPPMTNHDMLNFLGSPGDIGQRQNNLSPASKKRKCSEFASKENSYLIYELFLSSRLVKGPHEVQSIRESRVDYGLFLFFFQLIKYLGHFQESAA